MTFKPLSRPPRIYVAIPTSGKDGQMRLAGIFRYLSDGRLWNLQLVRSRFEFNKVTLEKALHGGIDGLIIAIPYCKEEIDLLAATSLPVVVMTNTVTLSTHSSRISKLVVDNGAIGKTAARYFLSRGQFRSFAYVSDTLNSQWSMERERAFKATIGVKAHFSTFNPQAEYPEKRMLPEAELGDWLKSLPHPTAILAANDHYAIQILSVCRTCSLNVPGQISVLGVDNDELLAENATPTLSSIEPDFNEAGYHAAAEMDRLLKARKGSTGRELVCGVKRLVERHSTVYLTPSAQLVANAIEFIRRNAASGITPSDIVRHLRVSRSLIELRMHEIHGKSITQVLREHRLALAKRQLEGTDLPITRILSDCGYKNVRAAENLFRKTTGLTPREWRAKSHEGSAADDLVSRGPSS